MSNRSNLFWYPPMTRYRDPYYDPFRQEPNTHVNSNADDSIVHQQRPHTLRTPIPQPIATNGSGARLGDRFRVNHNSADYQAGFIQGRAIEHHRLMQNQRARDDENTANGMIAGIILTTLLSLGIGMAYVLSQRTNTPQTIERTIVVPAPQSGRTP